ncbi:hypothetical protein NGA_0203900 [Nannochloropsis gaditana CCMP526]|uniref:uncharacterized protein n=1 Tax=Nannochloropsis gaditana (strain CCMP526) TaxID=1093141 RepID=UPI00029F7CFF|nr:hypothetical protein NGA_0203900 [Nannochloropsis gaditana CCMP526]EKU22217.1 hypothetical protein NGA_0203900 [Nannochloropsis gaditana CCMP526]|eukprot:XP_005854140.1 hypothetical protein NGA_0203900 [Nannochloropsis gaditana CCMP526]
MCSSNTFHHHVHDDERVDRARGLLCEGASLLVQTQESTDIIDSSRHLQQCLDKFDCALRLAPHLRAHACIAKLQGWNAGLAVLDQFHGYDNRLCMMEVLALYKGKTNLESVFDCACGDPHSAARASFACALFFEAHGTRAAEKMSLPLLHAVATVHCGGDTYLQSLARIHMRHVQDSLHSIHAHAQDGRRTPLSCGFPSSSTASTVSSPAALASPTALSTEIADEKGRKYDTPSVPLCSRAAKAAVLRRALVKNSC